MLNSRFLKCPNCVMQFVQARRPPRVAVTRCPHTPTMMMLLHFFEGDRAKQWAGSLWGVVLTPRSTRERAQKTKKQRQNKSKHQLTQISSTIQLSSHNKFTPLYFNCLLRQPIDLFNNDVFDINWRAQCHTRGI
jgi:hypothetical protein